MAGLSISKAWDDARPIIARDGRLMFIIALATVVLPQAILTLVAPDSGETVDGAEGSSFLLLGLNLLLALVNVVGSIAIATLALTKGASVADGLMRGLRRLLPTIGASFVLLIVVMAIVFGLMLIGFAGSLPDLSDPEAMPEVSALGVFAVLAILPILLFVGVRFMMMTPVIAAENEGIFGILRRTWRLTSGHFWRLLGFLILFGIGAIVFILGTTLVGGLLVKLLLGDPDPLTPAALVMGLISGLAAAVITIVYSTILARLYLQLAGKPADPDAEELRAAD
ncbi:glycerophosphoryl diester phosphodiesterase membrane domain-containing protein [Sphingomicrobium sp. XHP0239]|uniref:glycerophosphoryl diester phosphodiesterase membrane domain-containing protein n=1 Tax=Sphingomicrobium maritimum TaxID=3133972 RepID=UPI0031CC5EF1